VIYRRAASPLHAARAAAGSAYCAALAAVALIADHPVILAAVLVAEVCAAAAAGTAPLDERGRKIGEPGSGSGDGRARACLCPANGLCFGVKSQPEGPYRPCP